MAHARGGTIFAPVSKKDPKHGRWILPLVVLALVAFTYTFVNSLPPAEAPTTTTPAAGAGTTTTEAPEATTTTTLAPEVIAFVATVDALEAEAEALSGRAETMNTEYPDTAGYSATRDLMTTFKVDASDFAEKVDGVVVLAAAVEKWADVRTAANAIEMAADDMLDGLTNTSGSEKRLKALEDINIATATFAQTLGSAKIAATDG